MPINIFNIKNLNFLKNESYEDHSHPGEGNLSRQNVQQLGFLKQYLKTAASSSNKTHAKTRSGSAPKTRPDTHDTSQNSYRNWSNNKATETRPKKSHKKTKSNLLPNTHTVTEDLFESNVYRYGHERDRSADAKSLLSMMTTVNELKKKDPAIKNLFQKLAKPDVFDKKLQQLLQNIGAIKQRFISQPCSSEGTQRSSRKPKSTLVKQDPISTETEDLASIQASIDNLIQELGSTTALLKSKLPAKRNVSTQKASQEPSSIQFANLNTANLIKEYSRGFMLGRKCVNPMGESGNEFLKRLAGIKFKTDMQNRVLFCEVFAMAQEHALVEESLRMLQEKGFDLEQLFMKAYGRLDIRGVDVKNSMEVEQEVPHELEVSGASFESVRVFDKQQDKNIFNLDFFLLEYSHSEDQG